MKASDDSRGTHRAGMGARDAAREPGAPDTKPLTAEGVKIKQMAERAAERAYEDRLVKAQRKRAQRQPCRRPEGVLDDTDLSIALLEQALRNFRSDVNSASRNTRIMVLDALIRDLKLEREQR